MTIVIELPATLRPYASGESRVALDGEDSFGGALDALVTRHPRLRKRLLTSSGAIYDFVGVFVNDRRLDRDDMPHRALADGDVVSFVPAMAGG